MDKLTLVADALRQMPDIKVSKRGQGAATFLYVQSDVRAIEVSLDENDIYVEYWNVADEESKNAPVRKRGFDNPDDAVQSITKWLA